MSKTRVLEKSLWEWKCSAFCLYQCQYPGYDFIPRVVSQDVAIQKHRFKDTQKFSALLPTTACESTII